MKILLTGATGFIGSHLAQRLVAEGHELAILVRPSSSLDVLKPILPDIQVNIYDGSYASMLSALEAAKPSMVCHIASLFLAQHKPEDVTRLIESNINFPTQLLEAMNHIGVKQVINTGTSWQHFKNDFYNPVNLYAATKQAFESLLEYYIEAQGFKAVTLKLFDTYGPGDSRPKLFSMLRNAALSQERLFMSPGEQVLDLVYIDDVIDAFVNAIHMLPSQTSGNRCFGVSSERPIRLKDLVAIYEKTLNLKLKIDWGGRNYRVREVMCPWSAPLLPGWHAHVELEDGLVRMERG